MPSIQQVDSWATACHRTRQLVTGAVCDLVDVGPKSVPHVPHAPNRVEQDRTDRKDGYFTPTPVSGSRRSGRSDPTAARVIGWEINVQTATTYLWKIAWQTAHVVDSLGLETRDKDGNPVPFPANPATELPEATYARPNPEPRVMVGPNDCKAYVKAVSAWLEAAIDAIAVRWRKAEDDAADGVAAHAKALRDTLERTARRLDVQIRPCACGCGRDAPPQGQGATRADCRKRAERERAA
jgi:hypothetical protein